MKNNEILLSDLIKKIGNDEAKECLICEELVTKNDQKYCINQKCRVVKKQTTTRKRNILERTTWRGVEIKLLKSSKSLSDNPIFPYLIVESIIKNNLNEDVREMLAQKLGMHKNKLIKEGIPKIYQLKEKEIKLLVELVVLKMLGLKRAQQIAREKLEKRG